MEELRNREKLWRLLCLFGCDTVSLAKEGGVMSSWVFVVVRIKVNSGGAATAEGRDVCVGVTSSLILSLFLRISLRVIVVSQA